MKDKLQGMWKKAVIPNLKYYSEFAWSDCGILQKCLSVGGISIMACTLRLSVRA
jgi:hypothetical protein